MANAEAKAATQWDGRTHTMVMTSGRLTLTGRRDDVVDTIHLRGTGRKVELTFESDPDLPTVRELPAEDLWKMLYGLARP